MLLKKNILYICAFLLAMKYPCKAQVLQQVDSEITSRGLIKSQEAIADLKFLKSALEEAHPSLYRHINRDSLDCYIKQAEKELNQGISKRDLKIILQQLVVKIGSGHTYFLPGPSAYNPQLHFYFPFLVTSNDNRVFIYKSLHDKYKNFVGQEIVSIEGEPAEVVLNKVRSCISADANLNYYKDFKIENTMAFINLFYELYGFKKKYDIVLKDHSGQLIQYSIPAYFYNNPDKSFVDYLIPAYKNPSDMREFYLSDRIASTGILKLKSFYYKDYEQYREFDRNVFTNLKTKNVKNLVIDLRGNSGGSFYAVIDILRYLIPNDFQLLKDLYAPVDKLSFKVSDEPNQNSSNEARYISRPGGGFTLETMSTKTIRPYTDLLFSGNIYMLCDGGTFSAASMFAFLLKAHRKVMVIGKEQGGLHNGLDSSPFCILELPNSQLKLIFPRFYATIGYSKHDSKDGIGLDVQVQPSPSDLYEHKDAWFKKLEQIIQPK